MCRPRRNSVKKQLVDFTETKIFELVNIARKTRSKKKSDQAFEEIKHRMDTRIKQISFKFTIPGYSSTDICQEALFALRYKAVKDYEINKGHDGTTYPFEKFAVLCMRRHLATKLKASYQNKQKALNSSLSLDQDRNESNDDSLSLVNIIPHTGGSVLTDIEKNEYFRILISQLLSKLSVFEKQVFLLYAKRNSYEEISSIINKKARKGQAKVNVKSVDNGLSRIKQKARKVFKRFG